MEIVIAANGMAFGPASTKNFSLGGSETAVIELARALKKQGHLVTIFCNPGRPERQEYFASGTIDEDGVRWCHLDVYQLFITSTTVDLLIASRDPRLIALPAQARKKVLWMHDIATVRGMGAAFDQMAWTFDEIWAVSEFHRQQINKATNYPLHSIKVIRNGIVRVPEFIRSPRSETQLLFASRPERGLLNVLRVMDHLQEFNLKVCMYEHFPEEMRPFYEQCFAEMKKRPNVEYVGGLGQPQMRRLISESTAYIYPTQFEETSCILARECIEQTTLFFTTKKGALPETLGECGIYFEDWLEGGKHKPAPEGSDEWCKLFAQFVRERLTQEQYIADTTLEMTLRRDLYWDDVAREIQSQDLMLPVPAKPYSQVWSMIQDGDVIPAYAQLCQFIANSLDETGSVSPALVDLSREIEDFYPFLLDKDADGYEDIASYYARFYDYKKMELSISTDFDQSDRFKAIEAEVAKLPPGAYVVEYGCGEGHVLAALAKKFPDKNFAGYDQVQANVERVNLCRDAFNLDNIVAYSATNPSMICASKVDLVICTEVLEHCVKPWEIAQGVEKLAKKGGRVVVTCPFGAWEPSSFRKSVDDWPWRNHIWEIDKRMMREMFGAKPNVSMVSLVCGHLDDNRAYGHLVYSYDADHEPIPAIDPLWKAQHHNSRRTAALAVIAYNNEDTIVRMLNSVEHQVNHVQIAHGPSTDDTLPLIEDWFAKRPWITHTVIQVPKIEPPTKINEDGTFEGGFGFEDARNISVRGLEDTYDFVMWMDTDEYLSGNIKKYLRANCHDAYLIPQHHFTVEPRGAAIQIDRPARLMRSGRGFRCVGKIHEHFEVPEGGPGHAFMLPDCDLGHTGYVNEAVRRERFNRNFPFLVWDHHVNPNRKLGKYLWLRDIIHRMRYSAGMGDHATARQLAAEAVQYHKTHEADMAAFGQGTFLALQYVAEAHAFLGTGVPVEFGIRLDGAQIGFNGRFSSVEEITGLLERIMKDEMERRQSRYY